MTKKVKCINCESTNLTRVRPKNSIAFSRDFRCLDCQQQFPAKIPTWGSIVFMLLGLLLGSFGAVLTYLNLLNLFKLDFSPSLSFPFGLGMLTLGVVLFWNGLTSIGRS